MKPGILLVAYGSVNFKGTSTIRHMQQLAEQRFNLPIRWAFTSDTIRMRLAHKRTKSDSVFKALARMSFEKFTHVAVQSLHVIPGNEYDAVQADCSLAIRQYGLAVQMGPPLLTGGSSSESSTMQDVARLLIQHIPSARSSSEPVIYMAHGTTNACGVLYDKIAVSVNALDSLVFTLPMISSPPGFGMPPHSSANCGGTDRLSKTLAMLGSQFKTIWLLPMLSLVGKHTIEDIAGDSSTSWKKQIEAHGFLCQAEIKGLADDPNFVSLWFDRVDASLKKLYLQTKSPCSI